MNNRIIIITGTPGVGKTLLAKTLANNIGAAYVSVNSLVQMGKLHHGYDRKIRSYIIDPNRVKRKIRLILSKTHVVLLETNYVQGIIPGTQNIIAIVLRLDPVILYNRLRKRNWSKRKSWENVEAELVDATFIDAIGSLGYRRVFQIDTTQMSRTKLERIAMKIIKGHLHPHNRVDWLSKYDPIRLRRRLT